MKNEDFKAMVNDAIEKTIAQGQQSISVGSTCAYDGGNGLRCVVGHMMNDEEFKRFGTSGSCVKEMHAPQGFKPDLTIKQMNVLDVLQDCHDDASGDFVAEFKGQLLESKITEMMEAL